MEKTIKTRSFEELYTSVSAPWPESLLGQIQEFRKKHPSTFFILDDDPTGNQSSEQVPVLCHWSTESLQDELDRGTEQCFLLTNSRSLTEAACRDLYHEIGSQIRQLSTDSNRKIALISRSDSTLRGHYPAEVEALAGALQKEHEMLIFIPAFFEGGRYTYHGIHYYRLGDELIPVGQSPYASDPAFAYTHSFLPDWVEEKSKGSIKKADVLHIYLDEIRQKGPQYLADKVREGKPKVVTADALAYRDLEVLALMCCYLEASGSDFSIRSAASFLSPLVGKEAAQTLHPNSLPKAKGTGGLVVVGSVVDKTNRQLAHLKDRADLSMLEISVPDLLKEPNKMVQELAQLLDIQLAQGKTTVMYTSRNWIRTEDKDDNLERSQAVSDGLVQIVKQLSVRPAFFLAKGGITSSDLASKGLGIKRAWVEGPLLPGIPLWTADEQSKWPGLPYLVFPGNVGEDGSLLKAINILQKGTN